MKSRIPPRGVPLPPNFCSLISIVRNPLQPHKLLALYHTMVMARAIYRRLWVLEKGNEVLRIHGESPPHLTGGGAGGAGGAEVIQVAAAAALRPGTDWIVPHHRDLALCLALGVSPLDVMLTALGRASDLGSRQARIVTTSGLAATHMPHAAGIAYASKLTGPEKVTPPSIHHPPTPAPARPPPLNLPP